MKTNKLILFILIPGLMFLPTCKKVEKEMMVTTGGMTEISITTAKVTGQVLDLGEGANQHGHCYSKTANPTVNGTKTTLGTPALGGFTSSLTGLDPETKYYVKAYISRGSDVVYGSEINFTTAPLTTPGAPTSVIATAGNAQATVTFVAPVSDGGSPITGYTATSSPGGLTGTGTASPITVLGLTNGTAYTFTVTATNVNGTGTASSSSNSVTPSTVPGAPTGVIATAGNALATVEFTAPASNGGSAITSYTVTSTPNGFIGTGSSSPIIVTGLTNLTAYTFTVVATNINGNSASSAASNSVIPGTVTNPTTGKIWMDRNLGASQVATSSTDAASYGDLYQWGRRTDGHQIRTSGTTTTLSSSDTPVHGNFILVSASPYDWRNPQNDNLWQGVNGTNNPCPVGYRLPTEAEWNAERLSWSTNNAAGAFASPLKLPVAGDRSNSSGLLYGVGSFGGYWSSTVSSTWSRYLNILSSGADMGNDARTRGYSVRCIKD